MPLSSGHLTGTHRFAKGLSPAPGTQGTCVAGFHSLKSPECLITNTVQRRRGRQRKVTPGPLHMRQHSDNLLHPVKLLQNLSWSSILHSDCLLLPKVSLTEIPSPGPSFLAPPLVQISPARQLGMCPRVCEELGRCLWKSAHRPQDEARALLTPH